MNLEQFVPWASGQSLLYNTADPSLRGQCVQLVCYYVQRVWNLPVIWNDAYPWFAGGAFPDLYERIANDHNDPNQVPQRGDLIVWAPNLPGSGGAGHIAICLSAAPGSATFVTFDSNWGGRTAHQVTHNWSYVVGWMRPRGGRGAGVPAPAPTVIAPAPQGGDEMIVNTDQALKIYKLLRPNGQPNQGELEATVGRRSFAQFLNDAQGEVTQRDAALIVQANEFDVLRNTINNQNKVITELNAKLVAIGVTGSQKQAALNDALQKIASDNADMANAHDTIVDLSTKISGYENNPIIKVQNSAAAASKKPTSSGKFFAAILAAVSKFSRAKKTK